jgi:hypothetical protein
MYRGTFERGGAHLMSIQDRNLSVGTKLYAKYKGMTHTAELVEVQVLPTGMLPKDAPANPDPRLVTETRYRLADGREFKSPSAAGTAITGKACNGWAFWTVGEAPIAPEPAAKEPKPAKAPRGRKPKTTTTEGGETAPEIPEGTIGTHANGKLACEVCGAEFDDEASVTAHYVKAHAG